MQRRSASINPTSTWEDGLAEDDLGDDTAETPHIHRLGVVVGPQQYFGGAVPPRGDVLGQHRAVLVGFGDGPDQAEVAQLHEALAIEEYVAGLEVPVDNFARVQVLEC